MAVSWNFFYAGPCVEAYAIPGGSEEIMLNLAAGQFGFITRAAPDPRDKKIKALQEELKRIKSKM